MATKRDYYEILGVSRQATAREIKTAYRKLAVKLHPDKNPGDAAAEAQFKEAAEAYAVLSDTEKRARYDRLGHGGVSGGGFSGFDPDTFGDFADVLGDFFGFGFGGGRRRSGPRPGADLRYELPITLEQAAFGFETELEIPRLEKCETCSGSGSADGSDPVACDTCGGHGQVRFSQGFFTMARPCPACRGEGRTVTNPCSRCDGEGRVEQRRKVAIRVPPGVDTGTRLRRTGEGEHGQRGARPGDLYVDILVLRHDRFERSGPNVEGDLEVSYAQAVLGADVRVETLHGEVELELPPGTSNGRRFRLKGKGIERLDGRGRGDHVVRVEVRVPHPKHLSEEQIELLRKLAEAEGTPVREGRKVLDRVKDLFA